MVGVEKSKVEHELAKDPNFKIRLSQLDLILRNSVEYPYTSSNATRHISDSMRHFQQLGAGLKRELAEWSNSIDGLRKSAPFINYFTISQCMQLIHNFNRKRYPDVQFVFNLLRTINPKIELAFVCTYLEGIELKVLGHQL